MLERNARRDNRTTRFVRQIIYRAITWLNQSTVNTIAFLFFIENVQLILFSNKQPLFSIKAFAETLLLYITESVFQLVCLGDCDTNNKSYSLIICCYIQCQKISIEFNNYYNSYILKTLHRTLHNELLLILILIYTLLNDLNFAILISQKSELSDYRFIIVGRL